MTDMSEDFVGFVGFVTKTLPPADKTVNWRPADGNQLGHHARALELERFHKQLRDKYGSKEFCIRDATELVFLSIEDTKTLIYDLYREGRVSKRPNQSWYVKKYRGSI